MTDEEDRTAWDQQRDIVNSQVEQNMKDDKMSSKNALRVVAVPADHAADTDRVGDSRGIAPCSWLAQVEPELVDGGIKVYLPPSVYQIGCDLQCQMFARHQASVDPVQAATIPDEFQGVGLQSFPTLVDIEKPPISATKREACLHALGSGEREHDWNERCKIATPLGNVPKDVPNLDKHRCIDWCEHEVVAKVRDAFEDLRKRLGRQLFASGSPQELCKSDCILQAQAWPSTLEDELGCVAYFVHSGGLGKFMSNARLDLWVRCRVHGDDQMPPVWPVTIEHVRCDHVTILP